MRKILSLLAVLMLYCALAYSQTRPISGQVRDDEGNPIPFASIKIKGSNTGTSADANGNFTINSKSGDVLVISAVNYAEKQVRVESASSVAVSLSKGNTLIDEVVVTAQGIRRKAKELGYSVSRVSNEEITNGRSPQLAQSLSGKVSGLAIFNVNQSVDPAVKITLRGYRSLTGNNDALIVIDGMPQPRRRQIPLLPVSLHS